MATASRIYWSDEEKEQLAYKVYELKRTKGDSTLYALELAQQELLPKERQRKIPTVHMIPWLAPALERVAETEKLRREAEAVREQIDAEQRVPVPQQPVATQSVAPDSALAHLPAGVLFGALKDKLVQSTVDIIEGVIVELYKRGTITKLLTGAVGSAPALQAAPAIAAAPQPSESTTPPSQRFTGVPSFSVPEETQTHSKVPHKQVLVAGLKFAQIEEIRAELGELLDLRFWTTEEANSKLKTMLNDVDLVVGMPGLSTVQEAILHKAGERYRKHTGGFNKLKDYLHSIEQASRVFADFA